MRSSRFSHSLFGRPVLIAGFLLLALISSRILSSPDLGWHIRAGERIVAEKAIPDTDNFTHTVEGNRWWVNQSLSEILFFTVFRGFGGYKSLGGPALIVLRFLIVLGIWAVLLRSGNLVRARSELITGGVLLVALLASASHMLLRPFLLSALLLAVTGLIVENYRRKGEGRLWLLPVIFAIWAHVHPGFLYGTALLGAYCAGEWIRARVIWLRGDVTLLKGAAYRKLFLYSGLAVGGALVSGALINPSGVEAILLPIGLMKTRYFFEVLSEFQKAHFWRDRFFTALLIIAVASVIPRKRRDATDIIALAIFALFATRAVRVILPFAMVAAPIAIRNLAPPGERYLSDRSVPGRGLRIAVAVGILLYTSWWWRHDPLRIPLPQERMESAEDFSWAANTYPVKAYRFLEFARLPGEVFHPDQFGGSFIWYFYPKRKNFVDGRVEVFGEAFWQNDYFRILGCGPGWEDLLRRYNVNTLLLRQGTAYGSDRINALLPTMNDWALVYFDDEAVIYVRRSAVGDELLERRLELRFVDPSGAASFRSYEEEFLARRAVTETLESSCSVRMIQIHVQLLEERGQWDRIADIRDSWLGARGYTEQRQVLRRIRGEARFRIGDREGAGHDWEKAGESILVQNNLALLDWLEEGDPGGLIAASPARADELARLAGLLRGAREHERAAELLKEAVRAGGGDAYYRNSLAWTLLEGGIETEGALREVREAVRLAPDDGYARGTLARALLATGDDAGAEREIREAIRLIPADDYQTGAKERGKLCRLLAARGNPADEEEILALAEEALLTDFETENRTEIARIMIGHGGESRLDNILSQVGEIHRHGPPDAGSGPDDIAGHLRDELMQEKP